MIVKEKKGNASALFPIAVFLVLYLGNGIYFEYVRPMEGQMGFYVMSVVVAFVIALIVALLQNRTLPFDEKIRICAKGIGDENITIMLFIFLVAGAFSGIAKEAGGVASTANLFLNNIPSQFALPGLFVIACLISMAMGTSVGTITVLVPIATNVATGSGMGVAMCVGTIVGGAMFGDNLSFVSDTTIAATKTQGVAMKDKFKMNFKIALPAAVATIAILIAISLKSNVTDIGQFDYNVWQVIPYFIVLVAAVWGVNVFAVLCMGIVLFLMAGLLTHSLTIVSAFSAMGNGTSAMFETMIVTILVASIGALIKENGGFEWLLLLIRKVFKGRNGGCFGIGFLTLLMDIATANNTVAIVMAAPIAKEISVEYGIEPKQTASLLDTFSCIGQGIIPYGAQLLIAASMSGVTALNIVPFLFYPFLLLVCVTGSIVLMKKTTV